MTRKQRYETDPYFHQLVNIFKDVLKDTPLTKEDIQEALIFAEYLIWLNKEHKKYNKELNNDQT